eukprot:2470373-Amphidinium_carterae.1
MNSLPGHVDASMAVSSSMFRKRLIELDMTWCCKLHGTLGSTCCTGAQHGPSTQGQTGDLAQTDDQHFLCEWLGVTRMQHSSGAHEVDLPGLDRCLLECGKPYQSQQSDGRLGVGCRRHGRLCQRDPQRGSSDCPAMVGSAWIPFITRQECDRVFLPMGRTAVEGAAQCT